MRVLTSSACFWLTLPRRIDRRTRSPSVNWIVRRPLGCLEMEAIESHLSLMDGSVSFAVHVAAMGDADDEHRHVAVVDLENDRVLSSADAVQVLGAGQFLHPRRAGIGLKRFDGPHDPPPCVIGKFPQRLHGGRGQGDLIPGFRHCSQSQFPFDGLQGDRLFPPCVSSRRAPGVPP